MIPESVVVAVATGMVSSVGTVLALRVHVLYLREGLERIGGAVERAHSRIDEMERRIK